MQNLIREVNQYSADTSATFEELYDKYAPALYGKIVSAVKNKEVAEMLLEKIFVNAVKDSGSKPELISPFTHLLNCTQKKTQFTLKALEMLKASSCGFTQVAGPGL